MRLYDDDKQEAESIIGWTERRLGYAADTGMVRSYIKLFKQMWLESFGTLDTIPEDFKQKVETQYKALGGTIK